MGATLDRLNICMWNVEDPSQKEIIFLIIRHNNFSALSGADVCKTCASQKILHGEYPVLFTKNFTCTNRSRHSGERASQSLGVLKIPTPKFELIYIYQKCPSYQVSECNPSWVGIVSILNIPNPLLPLTRSARVEAGKLTVAADFSSTSTTVDLIPR